MEVKVGYRQTQAGLIPGDWNAPLLGELFTFKNGLNKAKKFFGFGTPIVNYMDVYKKRGLLAHDLQGRVSLTKQELKTFEVRKGDVFFTRTSETTDEVGMTSVMLDEPKDTVFSGFVLRARPKNDSLDNQFKKYCFSTSVVRRQITSQSTETTRALTNGRYLSAVAIPRPPKPEQEAIAKALSDADTLIESLTQLIAKKRNIKQGVMHELLTGEKRLPGFEKKKGYRQTEIGIIPEDWEVKRIGDFTDCTAGGTPSTKVSNYWGGATRWMTSGEIHLRMVTEVEGRITKEGLHNSSAKMIPANCVLIGLAGQGKTRGTVAMNLISLCTNQSIAAIFPNDAAFVSKYLFYNLDSRYEELRELSSGEGGRGGLNLTIIKSILVPFPRPSEQAAIAGILSDMDTEIAALDSKLAKARQVKQGMMQELLTGRIRLA